jgi:hypothetical protein
VAATEAARKADRSRSTDASLRTAQISRSRVSMEEPCNMAANPPTTTNSISESHSIWSRRFSPCIVVRTGLHKLLRAAEPSREHAGVPRRAAPAYAAETHRHPTGLQSQRTGRTHLRSQIATSRLQERACPATHPGHACRRRSDQEEAGALSGARSGRKRWATTARQVRTNVSKKRDELVELETSSLSQEVYRNPAQILESQT